MIKDYFGPAVLSIYWTAFLGVRIGYLLSAFVVVSVGLCGFTVAWARAGRELREMAGIFQRRTLSLLAENGRLRGRRLYSVDIDVDEPPRAS